MVPGPPVARGCVWARPQWRQRIADHLSEVLVQAVDGGDVVVVLDMTVAVSRLADARVSKLSLDPAEVRPTFKEPGGKRVAGGMVAAVDEPRPWRAGGAKRSQQKARDA